MFPGITMRRGQMQTSRRQNDQRKAANRNRQSYRRPPVHQGTSCCRSVFHHTACEARPSVRVSVCGARAHAHESPVWLSLIPQTDVGLAWDNSEVLCLHKPSVLSSFATIIIQQHQIKAACCLFWCALCNVQLKPEARAQKNRVAESQRRQESFCRKGHNWHSCWDWDPIFTSSVGPLTTCFDISSWKMKYENKNEVEKVS